MVLRCFALDCVHLYTIKSSTILVRGLSFAMVQPLDCGLPHLEKAHIMDPEEEMCSCQVWTVEEERNQARFTILKFPMASDQSDLPPSFLLESPTLASCQGPPSQACSCQVQAARMQPGRQLYSSGGPS